MSESLCIVFHVVCYKCKGSSQGEEAHMNHNRFTARGVWHVGFICLRVHIRAGSVVHIVFSAAKLAARVSEPASQAPGGRNQEPRTITRTITRTALDLRWIFLMIWDDSLEYCCPTYALLVWPNFRRPRGALGCQRPQAPLSIPTLNLCRPLQRSGNIYACYLVTNLGV